MKRQDAGVRPGCAVQNRVRSAPRALSWTRTGEQAGDRVRGRLYRLQGVVHEEVWLVQSGMWQAVRAEAGR